MTFAVITGGGTSGHVIPAIAICEALIDAGHDASDLKYVGTIRGVETSLMADSAVESLFLPISGLQRSFSVRAILRNMALPWRLLRSRLVARRYLSQWSPQVVVSVGGYASEPMSRAAIAAGIPLVCVSYDHLAGLATRRQAKYAQVCAVAFADSNLPRARVTGAPVRRVLRTLHVSEYRVQARRELHVSAEDTLIVFMGGSLGSQSINSVAVDFAQQGLVAGDARVSILHICGDRFLKEPMPSVADGVQYQRVGYESRMAAVYSAADVIVARAGASTVAEIATVGVASVLIPWPAAADNHQEHNARWLSDDGAALLSDDASCRSGATLQMVQGLVGNKDLQVSLAQKARQKGDIHRSNELVKVIENAASSALS